MQCIKITRLFTEGNHLFTYIPTGDILIILCVRTRAVIKVPCDNVTMVNREPWMVTDRYVWHLCRVYVCNMNTNGLNCWVKFSVLHADRQTSQASTHAPAHNLYAHFRLLLPLLTIISIKHCRYEWLNRFTQYRFVQHKSICS